MVLNHPFVVYGNVLDSASSPAFSQFGYERVAATPSVRLISDAAPAATALGISATEEIASVRYYKNGVRDGGFVDVSRQNTKTLIIDDSDFISSLARFSVYVTLKKRGYIYNCSLGKKLTIPQKIKGSFAPMRHNIDIDVDTQYSESGIYLGRRIKAKGGSSKVSFDNLHDSFVNGAEWQEFTKWALENPYYFSPFDGDKAMVEYHSFVSTDAPINASYNGNRRLMSVDFEMVKA
jgi:hypothetical protein